MRASTSSMILQYTLRATLFTELRYNTSVSNPSTISKDHRRKHYFNYVAVDGAKFNRTSPKSRPASRKWVLSIRVCLFMERSNAYCHTIKVVIKLHFQDLYTQVVVLMYKVQRGRLAFVHQSKGKATRNVLYL